MKIFQNLTQLPANVTGSVLVIGNFDAVHRGHQEILRQAKHKAQEEKTSLALLTFEPHPRKLFRPDDPPFRVTPFDLKIEKLREYGVDILFSLPFDWDFASQSADMFMQHILTQAIKPAHIMVGHDFCFGQLRKGTPEDLQRAGFAISIIQKIEDRDGQRLSSSRVRDYLRKGEMENANAILGWDWEIRGEVVHGDKRGRELGYPTANLRLQDTLHPAYGVYASLVKLKGENDWRKAATNIGIRPMFESKEGLVEAYIFDFSGDLYGQILRVKPVKRLRGEAKFDTLQTLIEQMGRDCEEARRILR